MWEKSINIDKVREIKTRTTVYFGVGAINKISNIARELKSRGIHKVLLVTGRQSYKISGAWDPTEKALKENNIDYRIYDGVTPNPTTHQVDEAVKIGINFGAQAVIAIGGGSPIDTGKGVAILLKYPQKSCRDLYDHTFLPQEAVSIIAINLTHGTGSETDRFAVVSIPENESKPVIAYNFIYPTFSIDDPALTIKLPREQSLYVTIDALNHVIEAATSTMTNPLSISLAKETVRLIGGYLPVALSNPEDLRARYCLLFASLIAGVSFDNGLLHLTHALEHPLSAFKPDLAHGLGLAILLPAVIRKIYACRSEVLADVLSPLVANLQGKPEEADKAACGVEQWLFDLGATSKLMDAGFGEADIEKLTRGVMETPSIANLLILSPIPADEKIVAEIFRDSLGPVSRLCSG